MDLIRKIEIKHFRSINELVIEDLSHINVFSGLNDVGKSNVIKALNLYFNNQVDWNSSFDFQRDTNTWHAHYSSESHNKRFISIRLTFRRPKRRYENSLPREFWIERYWDRNFLEQPNITWGTAEVSKSWNDRPRALTEFDNRSHFFYVPAIRGRNFLRHLLLQFSKTITDTPTDDLLAANKALSDVIFVQSTSLRKSSPRVNRPGVYFSIAGDLIDIT